MMNALAAALVAVGAMLVFFLQQQVMLLHGAGLPDVAPSTVLYSRRVVTRGKVLSAAVHVHDGRIQNVVPCDGPPGGIDLVRRATTPRERARRDPRRFPIPARAGRFAPPKT